MQLFHQHRTMILAMAVVAVCLASAGFFTRRTLAAPDTNPSALNQQMGWVLQLNPTLPTRARSSRKAIGAEANDQSVILLKSEEVVQDGTTSWGAEAQTYISPRYVKKNFLTIRAKSDRITVKSISVDRGNCTAFALALPAEMRFGESYKILVLCDPRETVVDTDHGSYNFSWDQ